MGMRDPVRRPQEPAPVAVAPGDETSREVAASDAAAALLRPSVPGWLQFLASKWWGLMAFVALALVGNLLVMPFAL